MPTSSQAMILLRAELGTVCGSTSLSYSSMPTHSIRHSTRPFPVSNINLNEFFELCDSHVPNIYLTKPSQTQLERQHICTLHGSGSIFDRDKKQVIGTCNLQFCHDCGSPSYQEDEETDAKSEPPSHKRYQSSDTTITKRRALTADVKEITRNQQKREEYERLMNLGYGYFDKHYHEKNSDKVFSNIRTVADQIENKHTCGQSSSTELHRTTEIPLSSLTFSQMHVIHPTDNEITCRFVSAQCIGPCAERFKLPPYKYSGQAHVPHSVKQTTQRAYLLPEDFNMEAVVIINPASEYNAATERINTALKTLKKELISLRLQDLDILKQLISINETIKTMSIEERTKRNYRHNFQKHATNLYATYSGGRLPMAQRQTPLVRQQSLPRYCNLLPQRHSSNNTEEFNSSEDETGSSLGGSTESVSELNDSVSDIPVFSESTTTTRPRSLSVRFNQTRSDEEEIKRDDYEEILKRNILLWKVKSRKVDSDTVFPDSEWEINETEC